MSNRDRARVVELHRRHVWPPYTSPEEHERGEPFVFVGAEGVWLQDADGKRYLDAISSWWTAALGHRHPRLVRALTAQAGAFPHVALAGSTHAPVAELAHELTAIAPNGLTRAHFSDDGSTAVEVAAKIALQYAKQTGHPGRRQFAALGQSFHGDTAAAMSLGGIATFRDHYAPMLFDVVRFAPTRSRDGAADFDAAARALAAHVREHASTIAAVIVEPMVLGAAGMQTWSAAALGEVRAATREHGVLLIADEVFSGFGRTGRMWGCDHARVEPDLLCTAKGLTGGMLPMAATLATDAVYDAFRGGTVRGQRALMHGHTFSGNPLGCAVAREVLRVYAEGRVVEGVAMVEATFTELAARLGHLRGVSRTRTIGAVVAADLGEDGYVGTRGWRVAEEARALGVFLRPLGDTVYLAPPLTISRDELDFLTRAFEDAIARALVI